jgi:hypothetical protein
VTYLEPVNSSSERKEEPENLTDDLVLGASIDPIKEFYLLDITP